MISWKLREEVVNRLQHLGWWMFQTKRDSFPWELDKTKPQVRRIVAGHPQTGWHLQKRKQGFPMNKCMGYAGCVQEKLAHFKNKESTKIPSRHLPLPLRTFYFFLALGHGRIKSRQYTILDLGNQIRPNGRICIASCRPHQLHTSVKWIWERK